jgi:hypothetical protein
MWAQELRRITKAGGKILIYVWAAEQDKFKNKGTDNGDLFVPWHLQKYVACDCGCCGCTDHATPCAANRVLPGREESRSFCTWLIRPCALVSLPRRFDKSKDANADAMPVYQVFVQVDVGPKILSMYKSNSG